MAATDASKKNTKQHELGSVLRRQGMLARHSANATPFTDENMITRLPNGRCNETGIAGFPS